MMGLEKEPEDERPEPPSFSGKALLLRFPNLNFVDQQGNKVFRRVEFLTFPHWVHKIQIDDKIYEVLGKDLQIGMPIIMTGQIFVIVDIKSQYYHGVINPAAHPMGYMKKNADELPKYKFRRVIKDDEDRWIVEEPFSKDFNISLLNDDAIDYLSEDAAKSLSKELQNKYSLLLKEHEKLRSDYKLLEKS